MNLRLLLACLLMARIAAISLTSLEVIDYILPEGGDETSGDCPEADVCLTEECVVTASNLLESLDNSTDPCDNFYQFACGGWTKQIILPPHRQILQKLYNEDEHLAVARNLLADKPQPTDLDSVKKAKALYRSCLNYKSDDFTVLVNFIRETFGPWPLSDNEFKEGDFSLATYLLKATQLDVHPLFHLQVVLEMVVNDDGKVTFERSLQFNQPVFGVPLEYIAKVYEDDISRRVYANKIYTDAKKFGIHDDDIAKSEALEIVDVGRTLAKLYTDLTDSESELNTTLGDLDDYLGELLNWTDFVSTLASAANVGITDMDSSQEVTLSAPLYLENMTEYFISLPPRTQANYIIWRVIESLQSVLITERSKVEHIMKGAIYGATSVSTPEETCTKYTSKAFSLVIHRLLYTNQLPPEELKRVSGLLREIQQEFDLLVDEHAWVDTETLKLIKEKNAAVALTMINFEKSMNDTLLDSYYENVTIDKKQFLKNVIQERQEAFARNLKSLRKPYERSVDNLPHEFVAQNFFLENQLEFTSIMFEPPLFINNVPMSVNYAGTGFIFGHEIVHAFDNTGLKFSKEGRFGEWWKNETLQVFEERSRCLVDQYSQFFYKPAKTKINGQLTLGENIADNAGIKLAYRTYKKHAASRVNNQRSFPGVPYNDEEVFFIKFAQNWCTVNSDLAAVYQTQDVHCPSEFRIIGPLQNSKDFARVFKCPAGSYMNPTQKCEVW